MCYGRCETKGSHNKVEDRNRVRKANNTLKERQIEPYAIVPWQQAYVYLIDHNQATLPACEHLPCGLEAFDVIEQTSTGRADHPRIGAYHPAYYYGDRLLLKVHVPRFSDAHANYTFIGGI